MKRMLLASVLAGLTVFAVGLGSAGSPRAEAAPIGAAWNLSVSNVSATTASFNWQPTGYGVQQWVDISHSNGYYWQWENGGPLGTYSSSYTWNGLLPNTTYYVRINTGYWDGTWIGGDWVMFTTQGYNCGYPGYPTPYQQPDVYQQPGTYIYPGYPQQPCYPPQPGPTVNIWIDRGQGSTYYVGQPIQVCYSASSPAYVQIIDVLANGQQQIYFQGQVAGGTTCLPWGTVTLPRGLERLHINGNGATASTYFYVQ